MWDKCLESTSRLLSLKEERYTVSYRCAGDEAEGDEDSVVEEADSDDDNDEQLNDNGDLEEDEGDSDEDENSDDVDSDDEKKPSKSKKKLLAATKITPSVVDDQFFKLSEMEAFLDIEDKKELLKMDGKPDPDADSEDDIDYFNDDLSEDSDDEEEDEDEEDGDHVDARNMKFSDFFDADGDDVDDEEARRQRVRKERQERHKLKAKRNKADLGFDESDLDDVEDEELEQLDEEDADDDDDRRIKFDLSKNEYRSDSGSDDGKDDGSDDDGDAVKEEGEKSNFELRQERLKNRIADMEDAVMGEKTWQLRGEVDSASRPKNSLLENVLEFDATTRPAPLITEETTQRLEDIIKQRIKDKAWDDVERKIKPINEPQEFRKTLILDQTKSKESLSQIYEKDYLSAMEKQNPNHTIAEKSDEPAEHKKIRDEMKALFLKLDALSNFVYTPKPVAPDAKIITNMPAIEMEEVAPVGVSDAALLAPEEIKARPKGDVIGKSERSRTDKNRERRQKKQKQKEVRVETEQRALEKEKLGIKTTTKEEQKRLLDKVSKSRNVLKVSQSTFNTQPFPHHNTIFNVFLCYFSIQLQTKEMTDQKSLKSSKAFFNQLQDQVTALPKKGTKSKRTETLQNEKNAKRLKL